MKKDFFTQATHLKLIFLLIVFGYFFLMFGNGIISMTHPDEVFYIQSAREMVAHNKWFTPMIFDGVQFEKPFFAFALFAFGVKYFGLDPFWCRFFPSLFGILGLGVTYWISFMMFQKKRLAFLSGIILGTSFIYLALSRAVLTDTIFSVIVTASLGMFYYAYENQQQKTKGLLLSSVLISLAVLTKGLLGITFFAAPVLMFLAYKRDFKFLKCWATVWSFLLFLALSLPWHIVMYANHGQWFLEEYFYNVHWRRILASEHARLDNWYFYIALMFVGIMPWFLFWIPAAKNIWEAFKEKNDDRDPFAFLIFWIIGVYIFVQPAHSKLASYIFPVFPAIAIILANYIDKMLRRKKGAPISSLNICACMMSIFILGVIVVGLFFAKKYEAVLVNLVPIYGFALCLFLIAGMILYFQSKKQYARSIFMYTAITAILLASLFFARPYIEPWVSCKHISEVFNEIDKSNTPVLASKFYVRGIRYYTDRDMAVIDINGKGFWSPHPIPFLNTDQKVIDFLNQRPTTYAIVKEGNVEDLKRICAGQYNLEELDGIGGKYILRITKIENFRVSL